MVHVLGRFDERLTVALLKMMGNPTTLVVGGPRGYEARQGRHFAALLEAIEADGEEAEAEPEAVDGDFPAESPDLSSFELERFLAELRRSPEGDGE